MEFQHNNTSCHETCKFTALLSRNSSHLVARVWDSTQRNCLHVMWLNLGLLGSQIT